MKNHYCIKIVPMLITEFVGTPLHFALASPSSRTWGALWEELGVRGKVGGMWIRSFGFWALLTYWVQSFSELWLSFFRLSVIFPFIIGLGPFCLTIRTVSMKICLAANHRIQWLKQIMVYFCHTPKYIYSNIKSWRRQWQSTPVLLSANFQITTV